MEKNHEQPYQNLYCWRTLYSKFDPFIMCDWQFMSWSRTKIPFSCQDFFKSPKSFEHESTVTTTGLELDLYRRRSLKVQSQSVNETIGQMMLYNKLKASVTSGSLVCGELFYASESPLEPERRRLYVLLYWRSASAISHMTFAIGQQKKNQGWIELFCNYLFFLHDLEKLRGKSLVDISLITD